MQQIGNEQGSTISWSDPQSDGGRGTGEVMVGLDSVGYAQSKSESMQKAKSFIAQWKNKR